jgi:hypothetical protein
MRAEIVPLHVVGLYVGLPLAHGIDQLASRLFSEVDCCESAHPARSGRFLPPARWHRLACPRDRADNFLGTAQQGSQSLE